jgi:ElaB/YqjD/DUF883 family membrane-anchored ribosome-binding protein
MTTKKSQSVDDAIDRVVEEKEAVEADAATAGEVNEVQEALNKAQEAIDSARGALGDAQSPERGRAIEAVERSRAFLDEARRYLAEAKDTMGRLATRTRERLEAVYAKVKEQYEMVAVKTRELYAKVKDKVAEIDIKHRGDEILEYIRSNPGKAVTIALAAGFVIGYVTRPRD